jgi:hypothetical protein
MARATIEHVTWSLVTVSGLIASGQVAQITYHLNRAMDNGLTQEQAGEVVTHLAFYAGWPNAFSALPVMKDVFEKRPHSSLNELLAQSNSLRARQLSFFCGSLGENPSALQLR